MSRFSEKPTANFPQELHGAMRWWRGFGLAVVRLALYRFSIEQHIAGYIALGVG